MSEKTKSNVMIKIRTFIVDNMVIRYQISNKIQNGKDYKDESECTDDSTTGAIIFFTCTFRLENQKYINVQFQLFIMIQKFIFCSNIQNIKTYSVSYINDGRFGANWILTTTILNSNKVCTSGFVACLLLSWNVFWICIKNKTKEKWETTKLPVSMIVVIFLMQCIGLYVG